MMMVHTCPHFGTESVLAEIADHKGSARIGINFFVGSGIHENNFTFTAKIFNGVNSYRPRFLVTEYIHFFI